jgi:predicted O-linked N-acetylglucosamine transferase (SPINDLY family)
MSLQSTLDQGLKHHRAGDFARAEKEYQRVLRMDPAHGQALHLSGFLAQQTGDMPRAVGLLERAVAAEPTNAVFLGNLGAALKKVGRTDEAVATLCRAIQVKPNFADGHYNLAIVLESLGRNAEAVEAYRAALRIQPDRIEALQNLGNRLLADGKTGDARECFARIVKTEPGLAGGHALLAGALFAEGDVDGALREFDLAIRLDPRDAQPRFNRGMVCLKTNRFTEAAAAFGDAARLQPEWGLAWSRHGLMLAATGRAEEAIAPLRRATELVPHDHDTWNLLGQTLLGEGATAKERVREAIAAHERAVTLHPGSASFRNNLGLARLRGNEHAAALEAFDAAVTCDPTMPEAVFNRGNVRKALGHFAEARKDFEAAVALRPSFASARLNLGTMLEIDGDPNGARREFELAALHDPLTPDPHTNLGLMAKAEGRIPDARRHFDDSLLRHQAQHKNGSLVRIFRDTLLPPVYASRDELLAERDRFLERLDDLERADLKLDPHKDLFPSVFYLPYQGFDDRSVQERLARVYARACGFDSPPTPSRLSPRHGQRLRIGFCSRFFRNHTIGRLTLGLVEKLSRDSFEVLVLTHLPARDEMGTALAKVADRFVAIPPELGPAREAVAALELDVLFYPDIGMDPFTYSLAFSRLASLQCLTWGHPVTSGIPTLDRFVSSDLIEPPGAEDRYSETLVRLPHLPVHYHRPILPETPRSRADFGLPEGRHLYLCPQSLFKLHPDFDAMLAGILDRDRDGCVVLVESQFAEWNDTIRDRFRRAHPREADRLLFVPRQSHDGFLNLMALSDAMLDPLHFGGGNTSFEALGTGLPIVTLPAAGMCGRVTLGCYAQMGLSTGVVDSPEEYVDLAVRLGTNAEFRRAARDEIVATGDRLFDNPAGVRDLEHMFLREFGLISEETRPVNDPVVVRRTSSPSSTLRNDGMEFRPMVSTGSPSSDDRPTTPLATPHTPPPVTGRVETFINLGGKTSMTNTDVRGTESAHIVPLTASLGAERSLSKLLRNCTCPACGYHVAVPFFDGGALPLTTLAWPKSAEEACGMKRLPHDFVRCVDCGHVSNAAFRYAEVPYSDKPNLMFNKGIVWTEHLRNVRDLIVGRLPPHPVVVEIGCGEGHLLRAIGGACRSGRFVGFDPNGAIDDGGGAIEARRELFDPARHLAELRPDLIISRHVLEHLMNPLGFVQEIAFAAGWERVETDLFIEVPCIDGVLKSGRTTDFFYEHNSHFTSVSLHRLLTRCASSVSLVDTGYAGEIVYGWARFRRNENQAAHTEEAIRFRSLVDGHRQSIRGDLDALAASGKRVAVWGGTGKAAAFINQYGLDAARFPLVVDSDPDKAGTHVPGTGQRIEFRDVLKTNPVDAILIATQWRAHDIALEIAREGIRHATLLIEHGGRIVDYLAGEHPYRKPRAA